MERILDIKAGVIYRTGIFRNRKDGEGEGGV